MDFCLQGSIDWFEPPISSVLNFLAHQYKSISTYGTLNSYRSALSLITNINLGSNEVVKRFCKGAANIKPSKAEYNFTWNPEPVVAHLESLIPHDQLNLDQISRKLVMLMALATGHRVQTFSLIKRKNISLGNPTLIRISDRIKTSRVNKSQPLLVLNEFEDRPALCIVTLLKFYLNLGKNLVADASDALFLTIKRPHLMATSQTISK